MFAFRKEHPIKPLWKEVQGRYKKQKERDYLFQLSCDAPPQIYLCDLVTMSRRELVE
jgi:hypothetical protein